jgi:uncharacterized protein YuzE
MNHRYLEVTFRKGRPMAACLYLPRRPDDRSARTERREKGLIVDFAADGRAIGIEITSPSSVLLPALNQVLAEVHQDPATSEEIAPLAAA